MNTNDFVWQESSGAYEALPDGAYMATFVGVEATDLLHEGKQEPRWRWSWKVKGGPCDGKPATATSERELRPGRKAGRFVVGMLGRTPTGADNLGEAIDGFKGRLFLITYGPGPKGGKPGVQTASLPPAM